MISRGSVSFFLVLTLGASCSPADRSSSFAGLDEFLDGVAVEKGVPGYSFAVFDDRQILYRRAAGYKNQETKEAVDSETVFEAASISKPVFAYIVLTMARDGLLDLDAPLGAAPAVSAQLGYDPRSEGLTARMLLAHLGGLPNWRARINFSATRYEELFDPEQQLQFIADPGTEYRYSGEGYVLLQQVVEQLAQRGLDALARETVFAPLGMTHSGFLYDDTMKANASKGHDRELRPDKWVISLPLASSTLHTTAVDLAKFGIHLASGIRRNEYYAALAQPAADVASHDGWEIRWGLGLGLASDGSRRYMYHGGNNVIFMADLIYGFEENLGYALLTNSANGAAMIEMVEQRIYGRDIPR